MPDATQMLYNLLVDPEYGIAITADDGTTVMGPTQHDPPTVDVKLSPYPQENFTNIPLVIVGPSKGFRKQDMIGLLWSYMVKTVEISFTTRDWDGSDYGFTSGGLSCVGKLMDNVRAIVKANKSNPDGTGNFESIVVNDPGSKTQDIPESPSLFKRAMTVDVRWAE